MTEGRLEHSSSQVSFATHSTKDLIPVPPRGFIPVSTHNFHLTSLLSVQNLFLTNYPVTLCNSLHTTLHKSSYPLPVAFDHFIESHQPKTLLPITWPRSLARVVFMDIESISKHSSSRKHLNGNITQIAGTALEMSKVTPDMDYQ